MSFTTKAVTNHLVIDMHDATGKAIKFTVQMKDGDEQHRLTDMLNQSDLLDFTVTRIISGKFERRV